MHGQQARYIPEALLEDFKEAYNDPEYAMLRRQIAINAAWEAELLRQVETGEGFVAWARLQDVMADLREALDADTPSEVKELVLCSQSLFRFADLGDDGLCRGDPDKGCGVIVSAIDVVVDRLD